MFTDFSLLRKWNNPDSAHPCALVLAVKPLVAPRWLSFLLDNEIELRAAGHPTGRTSHNNFVGTSGRTHQLSCA